MQIKKRYFAIIGLIILGYILLNINLEQTLNNLAKANLFYVSLAFLISLLILFIRSYRWKLFIESLGGKISTQNSYFYFLAGFFPSLTTPGRIGEFLKAFFLKNTLTTSKALASVISDRIYDIFALFGFAFLSSLLVIALLSKVLINPLLILALIILGILALFLLTKTSFFPLVTEKIALMIVPKEKAKNLKLSFKTLTNEISQLFFNPTLFLKASFLTLLSWLLSVFTTHLLLLALGINTSPLLALIAVSLVGITDLLPISIAGLGTREATLVAIFALYSLTLEQAISFSALYFIVFYIFYLILSYPFFSYFSDKLKF